MKQRRELTNFLLILVLFVGVIAHVNQGDASTAVVTVALATGIILSIVMAAGKRERGCRKTPAAKTEISFPRILQKEANDEVEPMKPATVLGRAYRHEQWATTEQTVDMLLDECIQVLRAHLKAHTVAVFFPTLDGGYRLRRFFSPSPHVKTDAVIYPGVGVIGSFLKDGLKQLSLQEIINDSATLYYYTQDAGIRSLMASPIVAEGVERGTIVVDSTERKHFTDEHHAFLAAVAKVLGQAVMSSYLYIEHKLQHGRLGAMSTIEKEFFRNLSRASIVGKIVEIVPLALPCDRLTISMKNDDGTSATILAAVGCDADWFGKRTFPLSQKTLVSVVYGGNLVLSRDFSQEHYEVRYCEDEPRNDELRSFAAVPLGVDSCIGMLLVESRNPEAFDEFCLELLGRLSTSAGLAIEKMLIFEQANALATHDGLTGLNNHRTFQQLLADEITRAIRFNEPVTLIIGDIDFFKKINDTWGHPFGDVVLKGVAAALENSIRQDIDTVSRYGGEEFALILVKTDEAAAVETAERIRATVAATAFRAPDGSDIRVTMSFGIAVYRQHARQLNELIAKADKALYRAKQNGRNRVEVF